MKKSEEENCAEILRELDETLIKHKISKVVACKLLSTLLIDICVQNHISLKKFQDLLNGICKVYPLALEHHKETK